MLALRPILLFLLAPAALIAQRNSAFLPYGACTFDDGLTLTDKAALPTGIQGRVVDTLQGAKPVAVLGGQRLAFAYPGTTIFADVKAEQLPADSYAEGKAALIANFEKILASDETGVRNYALKQVFNGHEIYGLDRSRREGKILGIYIFFSDRTHIATTIFFPNPDPGEGRFNTLEEYAALRDHFVSTFTACIPARAPAPGTALAATTPAATVTSPHAAANLPDAPSLARPYRRPNPPPEPASEAVIAPPSPAVPVTSAAPASIPSVEAPTEAPPQPVASVNTPPPATELPTITSTKKRKNRGRRNAETAGAPPSATNVETAGASAAAEPVSAAAPVMEPGVAAAPPHARTNEAVASTQTEPRMEARPDAKPEARTEPQTEARTEPQTEARREPQTEPRPAAKPDAVAREAQVMPTTTSSPAEGAMATAPVLSAAPLPAGPVASTGTLPVVSNDAASPVSVPAADVRADAADARAANPASTPALPASASETAAPAIGVGTTASDLPAPAAGIRSPKESARKAKKRARHAAEVQPPAATVAEAEKGIAPADSPAAAAGVANASALAASPAESVAGNQPAPPAAVAPTALPAATDSPQNESARSSAPALPAETAVAAAPAPNASPVPTATTPITEPPPAPPAHLMVSFAVDHSAKKKAPAAKTVASAKGKKPAARKASKRKPRS